jgi:SAM-dependent methyltransferase
LAKKLFIKFLNNTKIVSNNDLKEISLIEIGSGAGRMLPIVNKFGMKYTSIEPTTIMRIELDKIAKNNNIDKKDYEVMSESLPNLPEKLSKQFDLAIALHVLEHAMNPYSAREWLEEIQRVLVEGGYLLIITPHFPDYNWRFYDVDWSHSFPTTVNNIREILIDLNFEIITATTIRGWSSNKLYSGILNLILRVVPITPLDFMAKILFKQELLISGFCSGFLRRNTFLIARKI